MTEQPNKRGSDVHGDGATRDAGEEPAAENQRGGASERYPGGEGRANGDDAT